MGNFSVSHYTRLDVSRKGVDVTYVLDLAETPTYQLLRDWKLDARSPQEALEAKTAEHVRAWMSGLDFRSNGERVEPELVRSGIHLADGANDLHVARITSVLHLSSVQGALDFEDHNFPLRSGWKEIVIRAEDGAAILTASHGDSDRSNELTRYPADPMNTPPQDLRATVQWNDGPKAVSKIVPIEQPAPVPMQSEVTGQPETTGRGDYLSRLLGKKDIGIGLMLIGIAVAFGFGAVHALSPGHGKTIVAAYLVGSRGTMGHAAFLGAMVTFTHTISVFALGLATLFLSKYVVPQKIIPWLGAISGLSIVAVGARLFFKRLHKLRHDRHHQHHHHHHHHDHEHGLHTHTHVPERDVTLGSLIALGASGGLVPCPSALVLLLSSVALGHVGFGLILLVAFSLGLAGVLMAIGMLVLYAKHWLPDPVSASQHRAFRLVPIVSAAVIVCLGLLMTGVSLAG